MNPTAILQLPTPYRSHELGSKLTVRHIDVGFGEWKTILEDRAWGDVWAKGLLVLSLLWLAAMFFHQNAYPTILSYFLVKKGKSVLGKVLEKATTRSGKQEAWKIRYEYRPAVRPTQSGTMLVPKDQGQSVEVGDEVVVLHSPSNPARSVIYECTSFEAGEPRSP